MPRLVAGGFIGFALPVGIKPFPDAAELLVETFLGEAAGLLSEAVGLLAELTALVLDALGFFVGAFVLVPGFAVCRAAEAEVPDFLVAVAMEVSVAGV